MNLRQDGFTLIEMIMAIAILTIISGISFTFVANNMKTYQIASGQQKMGDEVWIAVERMVREVGSAYNAGAVAVTIPAAGTTVSTGTVLSFTDSNKALCTNCVDKTTAVSYAFNPATGQITRTGAATVVLADGITACSVSRPLAPADNVVVISIAKSLGGNTVTLSESAVLYQNQNIVENIL